MNQQEFYHLIERYGIDLKQLYIMIGTSNYWDGARGIYQEDGKWIYYSVADRNDVYETQLDSEEEAFSKIFSDVFFVLDLNRYVTMAISKDIIKIEKDVVCSFIRDTYAMSDKQAIEAWNYLKQDMHVLFEFKYYVANGSFVPEKYCYKVQGYTAEQLHKTMCLEIIDAFKYLIYLKTKKGGPS